MALLCAWTATILAISVPDTRGPDSSDSLDELLDDLSRLEKLEAASPPDSTTTGDATRLQEKSSPSKLSKAERCRAAVGKAVKFFLPFFGQVGASTELLSALRDEDDRRIALDALFAQLKKASDARAKELEQLIQSTWLWHPKVALRKEMEAVVGLMSDMSDSSRLQKAVKITDKLIKQDPSYAEAWNKRATLRFHLGKHQASLADLRRVLDLEPRHFGTVGGTQLVLEALGGGAEAENAAELLRSVRPYADDSSNEP